MTNLREIYSALFALLAVCLGICSYYSFHSPKQNHLYVERILLSLMPPVLGNLIIVITANQLLADVG